MHTAAYAEPYTDYEETGRLAILEPRPIAPWHSGVPGVYVAEADAFPASTAIAWLPAEWATVQGTMVLDGLADAQSVWEVLGGRLRRNIGNVSTLDEAVAAFNPAKRIVRTLAGRLWPRGPNAVYYLTRLRGASNEKARRELEFRPRPLEWFYLQGRDR
jgi:hypothetical protein